MRWFWICVGLPALAACSHGEAPGTDVGSQSQAVVAAAKPAPSSEGRALPSASARGFAPLDPVPAGPADAPKRGDDGTPLPTKVVSFQEPAADPERDVSAARRADKAQASRDKGESKDATQLPAPVSAAALAKQRDYLTKAAVRLAARGGNESDEDRAAEAASKAASLAGGAK